MHNYRKFKDYHIERLRDPEDAKMYLSVALEDYKEDKDKGAFLLAVHDVREAQGDNFLENSGIKEVSTLTWEGLAALRAGEIVGIGNTSEISEDLTISVDRFFQWFRQVFRSLFPNPLAVGTAGFGVLVLIVGAVYLGNRYSMPVPETQLSKLTPVSPTNMEPTLVKGQGKVVRGSSFDFGTFPKIPTDFPDQDIWNVIQKRSVHDPKGAKTLELLARVRIKLWEQGMPTKGVIMDPSSGLVYSDSNIKVLLPLSPDLPKYDTYFDDGVIPSEGIVVKFLGEGIDPYEFLSLPR